MRNKNSKSNIKKKKSENSEKSNKTEEKNINFSFLCQIKFLK
jgi:hypothetical protein